MMAAGLQVFDPSGKIIFDNSKIVLRLLEIVPVNSLTGSYTYRGIVTGKILATELRANMTFYGRKFLVSGNKISWTTPGIPAGWDAATELYIFEVPNV